MVDDPPSSRPVRSTAPRRPFGSRRARGAVRHHLNRTYFVRERHCTPAKNSSCHRRVFVAYISRVSPSPASWTARVVQRQAAMWSE
jgi:hypothetical protein